MNKASKFALAFAVATTATTGVASAQTIDNWQSNYGIVWMNNTGEHCWRNNYWTPATAAQGCGAPAAQEMVANKVAIMPSVEPQTTVNCVSGSQVTP